MSRCRYVPQAERERKAALAKAVQRITGDRYKAPVCAICGKGFTDQQLLDEDLIYTVSREYSTQMHKACFRKEFLRGVNRCGIAVMIAG